MAEALTRALSLLNIRRENNAVVLKPEQETAINNFLNGRDVMAILPTGFGKSMIYTVLACVAWRFLLLSNKGGRGQPRGDLFFSRLRRWYAPCSIVRPPLETAMLRRLDYNSIPTGWYGEAYKDLCRTWSRDHSQTKTSSETALKILGKSTRKLARKPMLRRLTHKT